MGTQTQTVPDEIPVATRADVSPETMEAIEQFYAKYAPSDHHRRTASAATIVGRNPAPNATHCDEEASVSGGPHSNEVVLDGQPLDFSDAYRTSSKHTYYSGVHVGGYRLTLEYHDASGGGYYRLRVNNETDV